MASERRPEGLFWKRTGLNFSSTLIIYVIQSAFLLGLSEHCMFSINRNGFSVFFNALLFNIKERIWGYFKKVMQNRIDKCVLGQKKFLQLTHSFYIICIFCTLFEEYASILKNFCTKMNLFNFIFSHWSFEMPFCLP